MKRDLLFVKYDEFIVDTLVPVARRAAATASTAWVQMDDAVLAYSGFGFPVWLSVALLLAILVLVWRRQEKRTTMPAIAADAAAPPVPLPRSPAHETETRTGLDHISSIHAAVIAVELLRHLKKTAGMMLEKADEILANELKMPADTMNDNFRIAAQKSSQARPYLLRVLALPDESPSSDPCAAMLWQRTQLETCMTELAMARAALLPALSSWNLGAATVNAKVKRAAMRQQQSWGAPGCVVASV